MTGDDSAWAPSRSVAGCPEVNKSAAFVTCGDLAVMLPDVKAIVQEMIVITHMARGL